MWSNYILYMMSTLQNTMNISQSEYETKYNHYLSKVRERKRRELLEYNNLEYLDEWNFPTLFRSFSHNSTDTNQYSKRKKRSLNSESITSNSNIIFVRFPLKLNEEYESSDDIEEATLKLMLITDPELVMKSDNHHLHLHSKNSHSRSHLHSHHDSNQHNQNRPNSVHVLNIKVYQLVEPHGKIWLDSRKIEIDGNIYSNRWIEFDVTKAVESWLSGDQENLGLEIHCDKCHLYGSKIIDESNNNNESGDSNEDYNNSNSDLSPMLNIIGRIGGVRREKRSRQHHHSLAPSVGRKKRKTECYEGNTKCCRHSMEVIFKEIKDFSFIIQPKIFDAGYCRGRCPPRYNPAHHHAVLQSLIWKKDRSKAPRPCCAPSKLVELEVLHIDEKDSSKLKVSTWRDMRVVECACS